MTNQPSLTRDDWFTFIRVLCRALRGAAGLLDEYIKTQEVKR